MEYGGNHNCHKTEKRVTERCSDFRVLKEVLRLRLLSALQIATLEWWRFYAGCIRQNASSSSQLAGPFNLASERPSTSASAKSFNLTTARDGVRSPCFAIAFQGVTPWK